MNDDDVMHRIAAWDWLALAAGIICLALLAYTDSGLPNL